MDKTMKPTILALPRSVENRAMLYYGFSGCAIVAIIAALWIGLYAYLLFFRGVW